MKPVLTAFHKERDFSAAEEINKTIFLALTCESTSKPKGLDCHAIQTEPPLFCHKAVNMDFTLPKQSSSQHCGVE